MARPSARSATRRRGGPVQTKQTGAYWPLLILGAVAVLGVIIWLQQRTPAPTSTGSAQPIATLGTSDFHALRWSASESNTVFFGHHGGILQSADGGRTWQPTALKDADAMNLATSPKAPQRMYAAGHGIFRRSDDGGATWTAPETSIQGADIHGFAQSPADPDRLYALVVRQGMLTSSDGGTSWTPVPSAPSGMAVSVSADGQRLLLSTERGVMQSADNGATWTQSGGALPNGAQVIALATAPTGDTLLAATTNGVYRRNSATDAWTPTTLRGTIMTIAISPVQPNSVLAVDDQGRVFRSEDGGATW